MVQERDLVADLQVLGLSDDVIGDSFVGGFERTSRTEQEAATESIEALEIDAINDNQILWFREDKSRSHFINARKRGNFVSERLLHDGTGKSKKDGRVGRLNEQIGTDTFDAFSPFG